MQQITDKRFVDLAAAFDSVNRKLMFQTITKRIPFSAGRKLIQLLESLYSHTSSALNQTPDKEFELTAGVRQGGPESPVLFNLFIDFVMRAYLERYKHAGIKFLRLNYKIPATATTSNRIIAGKQTINWLGYADDLVLVFENVNNLKLGLHSYYIQ